MQGKAYRPVRELFPTPRGSAGQVGFYHPERLYTYRRAKEDLMEMVGLLERSRKVTEGCVPCYEDE